MKQNHPDKRVIVNGSYSSPSALFADAVAFEGGSVTVAGNSRDADSAKATNTLLINLSYAYTSQPASSHISSLMRGLSYGATWGSQINEVFANPYGPYYPNVASYYFGLTDLRDFSAEVNSIPLVSESVISFFPDTGGLTGSVWADLQKACLAVYNNSGSVRNFSIMLDKTTLRRYGWMGDTFAYKVLKEDGTKDREGTLGFSDSNGVIQVGPVLLGLKQLLLSVGTASDRDADRMPDWWENMYSTPTDPGVPGLDPGTNDADLDNDGDGMSNYKEFISGTDPTSGDSVFRITDITMNDVNTASVKWNCTAGKRYFVYYADGSFGSLMTWNPGGGPIDSGFGGTCTWVDTTVDPYTMENRYYRVEVLQ
jgi:hypothetical protein